MPNDKPFLTYVEQLERIKRKKVLVENDNLAFEILSTVSYYGIINGYKDIYGTHYDDTENLEVFDNDVELEDLYLIYHIDNDLNNLLFKYIIYVEKALKTKISYIIAEKYGVDEQKYLDFHNYKCHGKLDRRNEIKSIKKQMNNNHNSASLQHYKNNHDCIPPWILMNALYFGTVINWYKILKNDMKLKIAKEFLQFSYLNDDKEKKEFLVDNLVLLQEYRNNIAHGNRTFLSNVRTEHKKHLILGALPTGILTEDEYSKNDLGKKDLFAVMLSLSSLINNPITFKRFIIDLKHIMDKHTSEKEITTPKGDIYQTLNIPKDFLDRLSKIYNSKF